MFTLAGRIRAVDEKADTITFLADTGERYIFALGSAEVDMPDGLRAGSRAVLSYSDVYKRQDVPRTAMVTIVYYYITISTACATRAVSYTHLDVYKRQTDGCSV